MTAVYKALNYSGMFELEFIVEHKSDAIMHVLEFNPRFSSAYHSYVGAGMVQDYTEIPGLMVNTRNDTKKVIAEKAHTTHVQSDTYVPNSKFRDYNAVKFYMPQPVTLLKLRSL